MTTTIYFGGEIKKNSYLTGAINKQKNPHLLVEISILSGHYENRTI